MIKKIKKYFTSKPKGDFWMHAFITIILFRFVTPLMLTYLMFFQIGLLAPDADLTATINRVKLEVAETLTKPMIIMEEAGQGLATQNPILGKILAYTISNFIWVVWVGLIFLIINLCRFGIAIVIGEYIKHKRRRSNGRK